jgi:hypothetical protein
MKRALLWLTCALVVGCAVQAPDPARATLQLETGQTFDVLKFGAGDAPALDVKLELYGIGIRVNDSNCKLETGRTVCSIGNVPTSLTYSLPSTGVQAARGRYKRGSSEYVLTWFR